MKLILHIADQLRLAKRSKIFYIDATGGIIKRSAYTKGQVYLFSMIPQDQQCVSVSDFVTERCRVEEIMYWLTSVRFGISRVTNTLIENSRPITVVTDMSWAIIHGVTLAFGGSYISRYLEETYTHLRKKSGAPAFVLIKAVSRSLTTLKDKALKHLFLQFFGALITASNLNDVGEWWKRLQIVFLSRTMSAEVRECLLEIEAPSQSATDEEDYNQFPCSTDTEA